jgi:dipeptidyl aminopeptidase/acylaminoacyl peptidase
MTGKITTLARTLIATAITTLLITSAAIPQSGKLADGSPVTLDDNALTRAEAVDPLIRGIMEKVEIKAITYLSDGLKVKGYLATPKAGGKLPCVIFNRGGNQSFGALSDLGAALRLGKIASWGYVVVASQYRGNLGGEGREEFGGIAVNDVLHLIPLLESLPQTDPSRIGMYGWSRGGMMTYIALTQTDRIAAAVVGAGMADSFDTIQRRSDMDQQVYAELVPHYREDKETALAARSAIHWPERLHKRTPILLLHGSADWRVHPTQALAWLQPSMR